METEAPLQSCRVNLFVEAIVFIWCLLRRKEGQPCLCWAEIFVFKGQKQTQGQKPEPVRLGAGQKPEQQSKSSAQWLPGSSSILCQSLYGSSEVKWHYKICICTLARVMWLGLQLINMQIRLQQWNSLPQESNEAKNCVKVTQTREGSIRACAAYPSHPTTGRGHHHAAPHVLSCLSAHPQNFKTITITPDT